MECYLKAFSGERFIPDEKDYARAESCTSEAKAIAQMNSITDLDKLFRRCIAFVTRGSYGTNAKLWMNRAKDLGASPDDIIKLYELIIDSRLSTANPNENAPDNSAIVASMNINEVSQPQPQEESSKSSSHPIFGSDSKIKYFARYNVVLSYADKTYAEEDYWSSQTSNTWVNSKSYTGNSIAEVIKAILDEYKEVIYAADIIDDRLVLVGYGYGNFGGSLKSSSYDVVADDIIQQSHKEYERGDAYIINEVNKYLHAIKLSIPIWMGNPNLEVHGYNYDSTFDLVTGLSSYQNLIPSNLKVNPISKFLHDAKSYDILAASKRIHGERDEGEIPTLLKSNEAQKHHVFGPYWTKDKGEPYYQYGYDGSVICYILNRDGKWWLSTSKKFEDLRELTYVPTWEMFAWDARYVAGKVEYSVSDIKSKLIKPYESGPLDLNSFILYSSSKPNIRVIGCGKSGYFCHDLSYGSAYGGLSPERLIKKYYESMGNAVYRISSTSDYGPGFKQVPFEFLGIKFTPKLTELQLPYVQNELTKVLNDSKAIFEDIANSTLDNLIQLNIEGISKNGTKFYATLGDFDLNSISLLTELRIKVLRGAYVMFDIKDKDAYTSINYSKNKKLFLSTLDKVRELRKAKSIPSSLLNSFKKTLKSYIKELSNEYSVYLPSLSITYDGKQSTYLGVNAPNNYVAKEGFKISDITDPIELSLSYLRVAKLGNSFGEVKLLEVPKIYNPTKPDTLKDITEGLIQVMEWAKNKSRYLFVIDSGSISVSDELEQGNLAAKYEVLKLKMEDLTFKHSMNPSQVALLLKNWESKGKIRLIESTPEFNSLFMPAQDKSLITRVNNLIQKLISELNGSYGVSSYRFLVTELGKTNEFNSFDGRRTPYKFYSYPVVNDLRNLAIHVTPNLETKLFDKWEQEWGEMILRYTGQSTYISELNKLIKLKDLNQNLSELYITIKDTARSKIKTVTLSGSKPTPTSSSTVYVATGHSIQDVLKTGYFLYLEYDKSKLKEIITIGKRDKTIKLIK